MDWSLYKIVFGLRHKKTFSFSGLSGRMVDQLLKRFGEGEELAFHEIAWTNDRMGFRLKNKLGNMFLECNFEGVVLSYHLSEGETPDIESIKNFYKDILGTIISTTDAKDSINRIGIIYQYTVDTEENAAKILFENLLKVDIKGIPDSFGVRYSLKNVTDEGLVDTTKEDYSNVFFQFSTDKTDKEKISPPNIIDMNIDYQIYFSPERNFDKKYIDLHFKSLEKYLSKLEGNSLLEMVSNNE
jgi:hypothetical protein